jgi:hypothetical protein
MTDSPYNSRNFEFYHLELLARLWSSALSDTPRQETPRILLGQLPENWIPEIAISGGSEILISLSFNHEAIVLLETGLSLNEALQFYRHQLEESGWEYLTLDNFFITGFAPHDAVNKPIFCHRSGDWSLEVRVKLLEETRTEVCLKLREG